MNLNRIKGCYFKYKQLIHIFLFAVVYVSILTFVISVNYIPTASMMPTIMPGDMCFSNRLAYVWDEPEIGDIIIFRATEGQLPEDSAYNTKMKVLYCKRIIATGGDKVLIKGSKVYINDELLDESVYKDARIPTLSDNVEVEVPVDCVFCMGDMRWGSFDSRSWAEPFVNEDDITGKVFWVCPLSKIINCINKLKKF